MTTIKTDWTKERLNPHQKVLTAAELKALPALYSQEKLGDKAMVQVHFFMGGYDLWATEFDPEEGVFFGKVNLFETELGYVSVEELQSVTWMERDLNWKPKPLSECGR